MDIITDWISAISAALALGFAIWTRYMAEGSKKAREAAELAETRAKEHLAAVTQQAASLEQIAQALSRPNLGAEWVKKNVLLVRNNGEQPVELVGTETEQILDFEPVTLAPGRSVRVFVMTAMGMPMPGELVFATPDGTVTVRLDLSMQPG